MTVQHMSVEELPSRYVLREQDRHVDFLAVEKMPEPLPLVDLSQLQRAGDEASKLQAALDSWGLFPATGHGIEGSLMNALMDGAREFFHQPLEMKQRFSNLVDGKPQLEGYGTDEAMSQDETLDWKDRLYLTIEPADVRDPSRWPDYPPGENRLVTLVIFIGDSLEIMNNGVFKAAVHRVVTNPVKDMISLAMFFGVDGDAMLEPAPSLLDAARPARYRKMRAKDYTKGIIEYHSRGERMIEAMKI